jgi:hypothetical protein
MKTVDELRKGYPELVAQIEASASEAAAAVSHDDAVAAERARLCAIDEIAPAIGDAEMVSEAKYGANPLSVEQLSVAVLKKQGAQGVHALASLEADTKGSGAANVAGQPVDVAGAAEAALNSGITQAKKSQEEVKTRFTKAFAHLSGKEN